MGKSWWSSDSTHPSLHGDLRLKSSSFLNSCTVLEYWVVCVCMRTHIATIRHHVIPVQRQRYHWADVTRPYALWRGEGRGLMSESWRLWGEHLGGPGTEKQKGIKPVVRTGSLGWWLGTSGWVGVFIVYEEKPWATEENCSANHLLSIQRDK